MSDNVKHPAHYIGKIETIDFIRDKLQPEQFVGYCVGNVVKYLSRYDKKGEPVEDLEKAEVYLQWAIEMQKEISPKEAPIETGWDIAARISEEIFHEKCDAEMNQREDNGQNEWRQEEISEKADV